MDGRFSSPKEASANYMEIGYHLIGEPLNLLDGGQTWFKDVVNFHSANFYESSVLLGSVNWMADFMKSFCRQVNVVDSNANTLNSVQNSFTDDSLEKFRFIEASWLDFSVGSNVGIVLGDNSLSYLEFPRQWSQLFDKLADFMEEGGLLALRCFSVPAKQVIVPFCEIAKMYVHADNINYTALRARLLFAHWDSSTYRIETEGVLRSFEDDIGLFSDLIDKSLGKENDLETVRKYKSSRAVYWAPPIEQILALIDKRFHVQGIHYGVYELSDYFPLIVARKA